MNRTFAICALILALALVGCGGEATSTQPTAATGAVGAAVTTPLVALTPAVAPTGSTSANAEATAGVELSGNDAYAQWAKGWLERLGKSQDALRELTKEEKFE